MGISGSTGGQGGPHQEGLVVPSCKRKVGMEKAPDRVSGGWNITLAPTSGRCPLGLIRLACKMTPVVFGSL